MLEWTHLEWFSWTREIHFSVLHYHTFMIAFSLVFLKYQNLLHGYECFTVKYATRRFHMKLRQGYEWHILHILASDYTADVIPIFFPQNKDTFGDHFRLVFFYFRNTHIYVIRRKLHVGLKIWSLSSRRKRDFARSLGLLVKYFFHSKINVLCSRHRVISSIYHTLAEPLIACIVCAEILVTSLNWL